MPRAEHEIRIVNPIVEKYLSSLLPERDAVLARLESDAQKRGVPIIGPLVGNVISMIVHSSGATKALEVGTATGYSGIWIARALSGPRRKLTTIEMDEERIAEASRSFKEAGLEKSVEIMRGDARKVVPQIVERNPGGFDIVFLDVGDKTLYVDLLEPCLEGLREGGFLLADNTLWGGEVANPKNSLPETQVIRQFNELLVQDKRLQASIIPIRDGFSIALKKKQ